MFKIAKENLSALFSKIAESNELYGEYQAGADAESKGPLTSFTFDDAEPSIVAERG